MIEDGIFGVDDGGFGGFEEFGEFEGFDEFGGFGDSGEFGDSDGSFGNSDGGFGEFGGFGGFGGFGESNESFRSKRSDTNKGIEVHDWDSLLDSNWECIDASGNLLENGRTLLIGSQCKLRCEHGYEDSLCKSQFELK